jgi:hypothetical protein
MPSGLVALSASETPFATTARAHKSPCQYQLVSLRAGGFARYARLYDALQQRWVGDTRVNSNGSDWIDRHTYHFAAVGSTFPSASPGAGAQDARATTLHDAVDLSENVHEPVHPATTFTVAAALHSPGGQLLERVLEATQVRFPNARVTVVTGNCPPVSYLRVSNPMPENTGVEQWPVGVADELTEPDLD